MKKHSPKKVVAKKTKRVVRKQPAHFLLADEKGMWGKDQPMILMLCVGIIICMLAALFFMGWL